MKNGSVLRIVLWRLVLGGCLAASAGLAQDVRTLQTKTADILSRFPAANSAMCDHLAAEILGLGEVGITEIARGLVAPGSDNDTAVRFALNCVVVHASRFGAETERERAEKALIRALGDARDPAVKSFLLGQLQVVGREAAVKASAPLLLDESLSEPAAKLMMRVGTSGARRALQEALPLAGDAARLTIVTALGGMRAVEANRALIALAGSSSVPERKAVLAALAMLALPESYSTLTRAARDADYGYEPANATASLLAYARNLGEGGNAELSRKVCRLILKKCKDADRLPFSTAALGILAEHHGYEALRDLLRAADHKDRAHRNAAFAFAESITGIAAVKRWIEKAQKTSPEIRAEIVAMLGRMGNRRALPYLRSSLGDRDGGVRLAAAEALARIEKADAAADLIRLLGAGPEDEAWRVGEILLWILDERHLDPLAAAMDGFKPAAKASAVRIIGARGGKRYLEDILGLTSDSNPATRQAAFAALKHLVGPRDVPVLLQLMDSTEDVALVRELQPAIIRAAAEAEPAETRARPLLEAMRTSPQRDFLLEVLPQVGGEEALRAVIDEFDRSEGARKELVFQALAQWRDFAAAPKLLEICAAGDAGLRDRAFAGFVRLVNSSEMPGEQKLLELRKILPLAGTLGQRRSLLRAMERVKTFQSFLLVSRYLDDTELGRDAAVSVMRLALPSAGAADGLSGELVRESLNKVLEILSGPESDYDKENIRKYLASMPQHQGFVPVFNGKDLAGWQGLVENPIARARMSREELSAKQAAANQRMSANWSVRDGMIVFNGKGDNLCSVKEYGDFEMLVDWRITPGGDSGIYLRGSPQVQIWDPARVDVGAQVGSGGLYNNQKHSSRPLVRADNPVGDWNTFRIAMIGEKVTVYLNGIKVVDDTVMENYWDRKQPIFPAGPIELQAHGSDLAFRDIYVREISTREFGLAPEEVAEGFAALFNGRDLSGWVGNKTGYRVDNGAVVFQPGPSNSGNLYTEKEYGDFQLRFEFQLTPGANNGLGIRTPLEGDAAYVGMELQILDDSSPVYANLQPYQYHGSVYGVIAAERGHLKPVGEWNEQEVTVRGSRIRVVLNGNVIVDGDVLEASRNGTLDKQEHPGLRRAAGHIGFLSHDTVVRFRNIRIKNLLP